MMYAGPAFARETPKTPDRSWVYCKRGRAGASQIRIGSMDGAPRRHGSAGDNWKATARGRFASVPAAAEAFTHGVQGS